MSLKEELQPKIEKIDNIINAFLLMIVSDEYSNDSKGVFSEAIEALSESRVYLQIVIEDEI